MKRKYPEQPLVGVGGIIFQDESVLLIKRGKEPALGQWSIPGGVVDLGETLQAAVAREIREETHIEAQPLALVKVLDRIFRDREGRVTYHYVLADFLCRQTGRRSPPGVGRFGCPVCPSRGACFVGRDSGHPRRDLLRRRVC